MVGETVSTAASAAGAPALPTTKGTDEPKPKTGKDAAGGGQSLPPPVEDSAPNIEQIAQRLNAASSTIGRDLRFEVDVHSGKSVIQVLDQETGELIRQIPPEKVSVFIGKEGDLGLRLLDELA